MFIVNHNRKLFINTTLPDNTLIPLNATIEESLANDYRIDLNCISYDVNLTYEKLIKQPITLTLNLQQPRFFHGYIISFIAGTVTEGVRHYSLEIASELHFLKYINGYSVFQNLDIKQLLNNILKKYFNFNWYFKLNNSHPSREYIVQWNESLYNFIQRITFRDGLYYFFKHQKNNYQLNFHDSSYHADCCNKLVGINPSLDIEVYLQQFSNITSFAADTIEVLDTDYHDLAKKYHSKLAINSPGNFSSKYFIQYNDSHSDTQHYNEHLINLEKIQNNYYQAESHWPYFEIGQTFKLVNTPVAADSNDYFIVSQLHIIQDYSGLQNEHGGFHYLNKLVMIPAKQLFQPLPTFMPITINGPQIAEVVSKENDIDTDSLGRIKVQFPWHHSGEVTNSCYIPVSQIFAGNQYGAWFLPRAGHHVLVQFINGNPERPIITGSIYHPNHPPPFSMPAEKTCSGFKFCSTPDAQSKNGNAFYFNDHTNQELIYLHAEKDLTMAARNNMQIDVENGDLKINIKKDAVTITAGKQIKLNVGSSQLIINENGIVLAADIIQLKKPN